MASFITAERRNQIVQILMEDGSLRINDMAKQFQVSTETIRKDLKYLEKMGVAKKSYGGAQAANEGFISQFNFRMVQNIEAKNKLAAKAIEYIQPGSMVFIDVGSTAMCVAKQLISHMDLTVVTNSLVVANILSNSKNNVYVTGGRLNGTNMSLLGLWTMDAMKTINPSVSFLGSSGFSAFGGPTTGSFDESEARKSITQVSAKSIVLADSSKFFNQTGLVSYASWSDVDVLITDSGAPMAKVRDLRREVEVVVVDLDNG